MDKGTDTWKTGPTRLLSKTNQQACLVHIYPSGPTMGQRFPLGTEPVVIGRGDDCDVRLGDHSVSRRHARLERLAEGYGVHDLQSTNGTFVNDRPTSEGPIGDGDYLRIGNCIFRFLAGGNVEAEYHEEIYRLTIIDALTGIHNKRYFLEFLDREVTRSGRHARPLSLVMFDLDQFKAINDDLGHLGGDQALRDLVNLIKNNVRREDLLARFGGEEFALVLVETHLSGALELTERLRRLIEQQVFEFESKRYSLTISLGVAAITGADESRPSELLRRADDKLFEAKRAGRNRVCS